MARTQEDFEIISPQRPIDIQLTYPHFTGFLSMMHLGIRGSQFGFFEQYRNTFFPERINFQSYKIMLYFNHSVLAKNSNSRIQSITTLFNLTAMRLIADEDNFLMYLWWKNEVFAEEMTKYLAVEDNMMSWQLFFLWFICGIYYYPSDRTSVPDMNMNHDVMSGTYILLICTDMRTQGLDDHICPDPCSRRPCASVPNVATELCFRRNLGLFIKDYTCLCKKGFRWHSISSKCLPYDLCTIKDICDVQGTIRCVYLPGKMSSYCECKTGYMGARCSIVRDPCIETSESSKMSGNMYCNTGQGNVCKGTPGTDRFECLCTASWTQDWSFSESNCLAFRDLCASRVCQGGDCVSSKDGQLTECICPQELSGSDCSVRRATWGLWLPWSSCDPNCGSVRRSVRLRFCQGDDCVGERRQVRLCEPTYCGSHPMFEFASAQRWKNTYYQMFAFVFLLGAVDLYICFLATCMLLIVVIPGISERLALFLPK